MTTNKENRHQQAHDKRQIPPDGGYGWIIVIAYGFANASYSFFTSLFKRIFDHRFFMMYM